MPPTPPKKAFQLLRPFLRQTPPDAPNFSAAFALFARIATFFAGPEFAGHVTAAVRRPSDSQLLYDLGYYLNRVGLPDIAIPVLTRLNALVPRNPTVLSELVHSLERESRNAEAVSVLRAANLDAPPTSRHPRQKQPISLSTPKYLKLYLKY